MLTTAREKHFFIENTRLLHFTLSEAFTLSELITYNFYMAFRSIFGIEIYIVLITLRHAFCITVLNQMP